MFAGVIDFMIGCKCAGRSAIDLYDALHGNQVMGEMHTGAQVVL